MHTSSKSSPLYILAICAISLTFVSMLPDSSPLEAAEWSIIASPSNSLDFMGFEDNRSILRFGTVGWGPGWSWTGMSSKAKAVDGVLNAEVPFKTGGKLIDVRIKVSKVGPRQIAFRYDLNAQEDAPLTMLVATFGVAKPFAQGQLTLHHIDGEETTMSLPLGISEKPTTSKAVLKLKKADPIEVTFDPPCPIAFDSDMRVLLAKDVYQKGTRSQTITVTFPAEVHFLASQEDQERLARKGMKIH